MSTNETPVCERKPNDEASSDNIKIAECSLIIYSTFIQCTSERPWSSPGADVSLSLSLHTWKISLDLLFSYRPPSDYRSASLASSAFVSQSDFFPFATVILALTISGFVLNLMYVSGRRSFSSVVNVANDTDVD